MSSTALFISIFNLFNESLICVGSGIFGLGAILFQGNTRQCITYTSYMLFGTGTLWAVRNFRQKKTVNENHIVFITGCDSGLGFNIAVRCHELNMFVVAGCLGPHSEGAQKLQKICGTDRMQVIELDVRKSESILAAKNYVTELLNKNSNLVLSTLVNNAAVMYFGEFEWQTDNQINHQIEVNLLGTMKVTKEFLPLIRKYYGRIINVTSHCSLQALPGLAAYGASKAALKFFNDALRVEQKKYNVDVVNFIPGSFVMQSNIAANQQMHSLEQKKSLTQEQLQFYGTYIDRYNEYLKVLSKTDRSVEIMKDPKIINVFEQALLEVAPKALYKCEPWRYKVYHTVCSVSPTIIRDWLIVKFVGLPKFKKQECIRI